MKRFNRYVITCLLLFASVFVPTGAHAKQIKDVNVVNTPVINLSNQVDNPLPVGDVQNPALQPFQVSRLISAGDLVGAWTMPPAGNDNQRAVIEHVTVDAQVPLGQNILVRIGQTGEIEHSLVLTSQGVWGSSTNRYTASQPIRLYSVGGGIGLISAIIERSSSSGSATVWVTLSGHLVNLP